MKAHTSSPQLTLILISLCILIPLVFFIVLIACNVRINSRNKEVRGKIQQVVDEENGNIKSLGMRWALPKGHFNWMELWIEQKINPKNTVIL